MLFSAPIWNIEEITEWFGYIFILAGVSGRVLCAMYVGGRKNAELVVTGPYSLMRNPLYGFSFIAVLGIGLMTGMAFFLIVLAMVFMLYYPLVVEREEKYLSERFGGAFADYARITPRWVPDFGLWRSPESLAVNPRFVWITFRDAIPFLLALPLLELIEYAHEAGWLPVFFRLY